MSEAGSLVLAIYLVAQQRLETVDCPVEAVVQGVRNQVGKEALVDDDRSLRELCWA